MKISVISFTGQGQRLGERLREQLPEEEVVLYTKCSHAFPENSTTLVVEERLVDWTGAQMAAHTALVFIGACGIAVRAIAPWVTDKLHDSPVLVMDEKGQYVIPLLSGHVGGANALAGRLAARLGAVAVITTATDVNGSFAVDLFAVQNHLEIRNKEGIATVSARVLAGEKVTMAIAPEYAPEGENGQPAEVELVAYPPTEKVDILITEELPAGMDEFRYGLWLRPCRYVLGVGCRKNTDPAMLEDFLRKLLQQAGITPEQLCGIASIDVKKNEPCLVQWSEKHRIPFQTFSAAQLRAVAGSFHSSAFVEAQVGVDNVCERAAIRAGGSGSRLILEKQAESGMTAAIAQIAENKGRIYWNEA